MKRKTLSAQATPAKESYKQKAYKAISSWILNDEVKPGDALVEQEIADRLQISRTPVREALHRLEQENLVQIVPHVGTFVTQLSLESLREVFELREAVEGMLARLAAKRGVESLFSKIPTLFEAAVSETDHDLRARKMEEAGDRLHDAVLEAAGNSRLKSIIESFRLQIEFERHAATKIEGRIERAFEEHVAILKAIQERDPERAENAMRKHIQNTREDVIDSYLR